MTTYRITQANPAAAVLIRIRRASGSDWQTCPLLAIAGAWVKVDDGQGPLWVMWEHCHPGDRATLATFNRLELSRN